MELSDLIPAVVIDVVRDRLVVGVADAEEHFEDSRADEDALTGALGMSIARHPPMTVTVGSRSYSVRMYYRKVRGRGPGAPEHVTGADGIFQIEVSDSNGQRVWTKGLPFQAKKEWHGSDPRLADQAADMIETASEKSVVIDYSANGYRACEAQKAVDHRGHAASVDDAGEFQSLGQMLGNDFLDCTVGAEGLYYDAEEEAFVTEVDFHVIGAEIQRDERSSR